MGQFGGNWEKHFRGMKPAKSRFGQMTPADGVPPMLAAPDAAATTAWQAPMLLPDEPPPMIAAPSFPVAAPKPTVSAPKPTAKPAVAAPVASSGLNISNRQV